MLKNKFVTQAAPNIERKLQKLATGSNRTSSKEPLQSGYFSLYNKTLEEAQEKERNYKTKQRFYKTQQRFYKTQTEVL